MFSYCLLKVFNLNAPCFLLNPHFSPFRIFFDISIDSGPTLGIPRVRKCLPNWPQQLPNTNKSPKKATRWRRFHSTRWPRAGHIIISASPHPGLMNRLFELPSACEASGIFYGIFLLIRCRNFLDVFRLRFLLSPAVFSRWPYIMTFASAKCW